MKKICILISVLFYSSINYSQPFNNFLTLDGVDDYVSNSYVTFYNQGDFTVELFLKPCMVEDSYSYLIDSRGSTAGNGFELTLYNSGGAYTLGLKADSGAYYSSTYVSLPNLDNKWSHIALTFDDTHNLFKLYYNGDSVGVLNNPYGRSTRIYISRADYTASGYFRGFIDELRISDTIRYNSNFTVPNQQFTSDANTSALYHFDDPDYETQLINDVGTFHLNAYMGANTVSPVLIDSASPICYGSNVTLNASGATGVFVWSPSAGLSDTSIFNPIASPNGSTTYYASSLDSNSCYISDSVEITVLQLPIINLQDTSICDNNLPYIANPGTFISYNWSTSDTANTINIDTTGSYSVTVTDDNNCSNSKTFSVQITTCTGFDEIANNEISIYPNPANDKITIIGLQIRKVEIIDFTGKLIKNNKVFGNQTSIDISKLSSGVYSIRIKTDEGTIMKKLIVKR